MRITSFKLLLRMAGRAPRRGAPSATGGGPLCLGGATTVLLILVAARIRTETIGRTAIAIAANHVCAIVAV